MRGLSQKFMKDLTLENDKLKMLLSLVRADGALDLEIRENYVYIFYRGRSLYEIKPSGDDYIFRFDEENYGKGCQWDDKAKELISVGQHLEAIPLLKSVIDWHIGTVKQTDEKETQQLIIRENNVMSVALNTDYYIVGSEYRLLTGGIPDLVAVQYNTKSRSRTVGQIALIEVKFGIDAVTGIAGVDEHITDIERFFANKDGMVSLKEEVTELFAQKTRLGLINVSKPIDRIGDEIPEYILLFADATPKSDVVRSVLVPYKNKEFNGFSLKVAVASMMGYALYSDCVVSVDDYLSM